MAINFLEKREFQRNLTLAFFIIVLIIAVIIWRGFSTGEKTVPVGVGEVSQQKKVEINFEVLKNPTLKGLQPFEEIKPLEGATAEVGRENPFKPY